MVIVRHIDCTQMVHRKALHTHLKEVFQFPDHYGRNLDALFDCLTELGQPTRIKFSNLDGLIPLGNYGEELISTFRDAALENPNLELLFSDF